MKIARLARDKGSALSLLLNDLQPKLFSKALFETYKIYVNECDPNPLSYLSLHFS